MSEVNAKSSDAMSPDASPGTLVAGVRRVNNLPVYILGGVVGTFLLVMTVVASSRAAKQDVPSNQAPVKVVSSNTFAEQIASEQTGALIPPTVTAAPAKPLLIAQVDDDELAVPGRADDPDLPPAPPRQDGAATELLPPAEWRNQVTSVPMPGESAGANRASRRDDPELEAIRQAKLQLFAQAVSSDTKVDVGSLRRSGDAGASAGSSADPIQARIDAIKEQMAAMENQPQPNASAARSELAGVGLGGQSASQRARGGYAEFAEGAESDRFALNTKVQAPRSKYELRTGFVLPATMISGINSDLPGQILAQVSQNVYDSATGKYLLIPQGARLYGSYSNEVVFGQARVLVAWQRIVFPDGKALDLGAMPGADSAGYSGFKDKVNNYYLRLYTSAFLLSGVTAGVADSQRRSGRDSNDAPDAGSSLSEALGQQLGQATAQLISKNANVSPTLEIRPGYRFNVIVTKDLSFAKPYQAFDYRAGAK
jgi:type IV secretion system protein VirB10